ncbi:helix-turn-helix domain-containing protein [Novosphingobium jiangmenense]|uniref:Helix-turn-helix domain-containing protein n=1 Tax=Novosphingobium jiangmenense TaxID=2791981 RepID=A0ABS0HH26_9SPHN|nr:helix-turn-helix domain-containing protein [Novosphingobium jiangmenense]MBF9151563.1 helix-turn-helix domain-containing protein [Novosphingobium jiangmenense]
MVGQGFNRYTLYGEEGISLPPEFIHLERIRDRATLHDWTIEPHAHPHMMQLLLLQSGSVELQGERSAEALVASAQVLVPPTCVHAFRFDAGAEGWVLSVAADLANDPRLSGLLGNLEGLGGSAIAVSLAAHPLALHRLGWLLDDLAQRLGQGDGTGPALLAQVALILATALEAGAGNRNQTGHGREPLVVRFRALVEQHYREHLSVADYAARLGTTTSTLTRATRALAGKPPAEIVHDRLILEARRNLAFSGASAAQIAYALGFADPAYFARFFKARTGQTTSAFRRDRVSKAEETA